MPRAQRPNSKMWQGLKPAAREFRHTATPAEDALWQSLRRGNLDGLKFRRQHAIGTYVVDFYCASARLVVEVDGAIHDTQVERDANRQAFLESLGLRVLRFRNEEVLGGLDGVLVQIAALIDLSP